MAAVALRRMRSSGNIPPIAIASSVHRGASIALGAFCLSLGAAWAWQLKALLRIRRSATAAMVAELQLYPVSYTHLTLPTIPLV